MIEEQQRTGRNFGAMNARELADILERHGYPVDALFARRFDDGFRAAMKEAIAVARELFWKGLPLAAAGGRVR